MTDRRTIELSKVLGLDLARLAPSNLEPLHRVRELHERRTTDGARLCPNDDLPLDRDLMCGHCGTDRSLEVATLTSIFAAFRGLPSPKPPPGVHTDAPSYPIEIVVDVHQALEMAGLQHQLALLRCDLPQAQTSFRRLATWLEAHVRDETELVLPRFARLGGFERGGSPELFASEHDKIVAGLREIGQRVEDLFDAPEGALEVEVLALLDRERIWFGLLEHHDIRERTFLYPRLSAALADMERHELVEALTRPFRTSP